MSRYATKNTRTVKGGFWQGFVVTLFPGPSNPQECAARESTQLPSIIQEVLTRLSRGKTANLWENFSQFSRATGPLPTVSEAGLSENGRRDPQG